MVEDQRISEVSTDLEPLTLNDLMDLYEGTVDELQRCARIIPPLVLNDPEVELREAALLDFEAKLLSQAATVQLRTKNDMLHLMDIWAKAANIQIGDSISQSDRIAMNIFRHLSDVQLAKD